MQTVTITEISPQELEVLLEALLRRVLLNREPIQSRDDTWMDLTAFCDYLPDKPSKATVYGWIHKGAIPYHKGGKKLRFLKSEIDTWLMEGKKNSLGPRQERGEQFLKKQPK